MSLHEIDVFYEKITKNVSHDYIDRLLDKVSEGDLYDLANKLLENPFRFDYALASILGRLFDNTPEFAELLCKFFETASSDMACGKRYMPLKEKISDKQNEAFSLVKMMLPLGGTQGIPSGVLLSCFVEEREDAEEYMIEGLDSRDIAMQRCCLVALKALVCGPPTEKRDKYFEILKKVAPTVSQENTYFLISVLQCAFEEGTKGFELVLESEITRRGAEAASIYVNFVNLYRPNMSTALMQKAVEILESESPTSIDIDIGLAKIYESNPSFVVKRLEKRLNDRERVELMDDFLLYQIREGDIGPVLSMIESQIDEGNPILLHLGEYTLGDLFKSHEMWIAWCEKWKDDGRKERVVLNSLSAILTELINYVPNVVRDKAVELAKFFAKKKGINYEKETERINRGSDTKEGWKNKENALKALHVLEGISHPHVSIDIKTLPDNLKKVPHLSKAIGTSWLIRNASSDNPHILAYILQGEFSDACIYWENVFKILDQQDIKIKKKKLQDVSNAKNILAEAEVFSRLAPHFDKIETEPDIKELSPKKLEALLEYKGEKALIEVATVHERTELHLAHGGISLPGGKVKNVLLNKFKGQLKEGKCNPGIPILIILSLEPFVDMFEVRNGIYGEFQFLYTRHNDTQEIVEKGTTRKENGFYDIGGSNIVTAVGAYKRDYGKKDPLVGRLYYPHITPRNKMSQEIRLRVRNALFGDSETSDWKSLMRICGIGEQMARLLYSGGIEDLQVLAGIREGDFVVDAMPWERLSQLREEARRVIDALSSGSVRFLKGIDQESFDILQSKGIYLIEDLLKQAEPSEGISKEAWALMIDDARRISQQG